MSSSPPLEQLEQTLERAIENVRQVNANRQRITDIETLVQGAILGVEIKHRFEGISSIINNI